MERCLVPSNKQWVATVRYLITGRNKNVKFARVVFIGLLVGLLLGHTGASMASTEDEQNNIEIY